MKVAVLRWFAILSGTIFPASEAMGGIPEPPPILYGTITIDGKPVGPNDDVTVVARVDGVPNPIGRYHMGDIPEAQDKYVLKLRLEFLQQGGERSGNAAIVGETADIYVQRGQECEELATQYEITQRGTIEVRNLEVICGVNCTGQENIAPKNLKCKGSGGKAKLKVRLNRATPGDAFEVVLTSGETKQGTIDNKGKGKAKFKRLPPGAGTATATFGCGAVVAKDYVCE